jgi:hypothetical protein
MRQRRRTRCSRGLYAKSIRLTSWVHASQTQREAARQLDRCGMWRTWAREGEGSGLTKEGNIPCIGFLYFFPISISISYFFIYSNLNWVLNSTLKFKCINRFQNEMRNCILFIIFGYLYASKYKPHTYILLFI